MPSSLPIDILRIQVWAGSNFQTVAEVSKSLKSTVTLTFSSVTTTRLRVVGAKGYLLIPYQIFMNEIEVFAN